MAVVTDFHSHILPCMDDGSRSAEESLAMLRDLAAQGITHVIATPHFYPRYDTPESFLEKRAAALETLRRGAEGLEGLPRVSLGAEVYFFRGMSESENLPQLTIGGKKCILIEMPPAPWPEEIFRELVQIWEKQRFIPVIAHIDRYISPFRTYGVPAKLESLPVLVQANADFFLRRSTAGLAMKMLKADRIHLLGSDCHNMTDRRPNLGLAIRKIEQKLGSGVLQRIAEHEKQIPDL